MANFLVIGLIIENWWEISWILSMNIPSIQRPQTVSLALGGQRHWAPTTHEIKSADWQLLDESPLHHYHHPKASIFSLQSYTKGLVGATFGPLFFFLFWFIFEDFFFLNEKKKIEGKLWFGGVENGVFVGGSDHVAQEACRGENHVMGAAFVWGTLPRTVPCVEGVLGFFGTFLFGVPLSIQCQ